MVVSKKCSTFAPSNKNKQQFKSITTMTKEELSAKIAQGEYTECQIDSKFSISFKIGDVKASATKVGNCIVAMTVISTDISEDDYNKIFKQALSQAVICAKPKHCDLCAKLLQKRNIVCQRTD